MEIREENKRQTGLWDWWEGTGETLPRLTSTLKTELWTLKKLFHGSYQERFLNRFKTSTGERGSAIYWCGAKPQAKERTLLEVTEEIRSRSNLWLVLC